MKPITSLTGSLLTTLAIILALGFVASRVSVSTAAPIAKTDLYDRNEDGSGAEVVGLEIVVTGIRNDKGRIIVAVFDKTRKGAFEEYDYDRAIEYGEFDANKAVRGAVRLPFPRLRSGPYAVSLFHDENKDYDFNMDGDWPLEGYGTSGAKNAYHEPTFDEASIEGGRVTVQMYYL